MVRICTLPPVLIVVLTRFVFLLLQSGIKDIKSELDGHLRDERKRLGCFDAEYWHSAKEKYQIQVPESYFSKHRQVRRCFIFFNVLLGNVCTRAFDRHTARNAGPKTKSSGL